MKKRIVLISCASKKLSERAKAKDLYTSTLFKLNLKYAGYLEPDDIFVLSAKYGLLDLNRKIEPYDQTLNTMRVSEVHDWAVKVLGQIKEICTLDETEFTFLAGEKYRRYLVPYFKNAQIPLEGLAIGKQLQRLKELVHDC